MIVPMVPVLSHEIGMVSPMKYLIAVFGALTVNLPIIVLAEESPLTLALSPSSTLGSHLRWRRFLHLQESLSTNA